MARVGTKVEYEGGGRGVIIAVSCDRKYYVIEDGDNWIEVYSQPVDEVYQISYDIFRS